MLVGEANVADEGYPLTSDLSDLPDLPDLPDDDESESLPSGSAPAGTGTELARLTAWVRGRVQGVGFRWWVRSHALSLGLSGWAENLTDGRVKVVAEGPQDACGQLLDFLAGSETPGQVTAVTHRWDEPAGDLQGFAER
jgi:acylphosphatase